MSYDYDWQDDVLVVNADPYSDGGQNHYWTQEEQDDLYYRAGQRIVEDNGMNYYDDPEEAVYDEMSNIIGLYAINKRSKLYDLLLEWYDNDEDKMMSNVRNAFEDDEFIYFVTGVGYDWVSSDLLGGEPDGRYREEFYNFVAERC